MRGPGQCRTSLNVEVKVRQLGCYLRGRQCRSCLRTGAGAHRAARGSADRNVRRTGQGGNHFRDQDWSSHKARSGGTASRSHIMMSGGEMTNMAVRSRWPLYEDDEISAVSDVLRSGRVNYLDRKNGGEGKNVSVRVEPG